MKLSIITVNLNNREGLHKTIDSVVSQTFKDFEWIVIDGGSTDGSKELIGQYTDHFAYWVSEPDNGIYNAMNKGIKQSQGDYLLFLNSGDWLCKEDSLESIWDTENLPDADIIYCTYGDGISWAIPHRLTLDYFLDSSLFHQSTFIRRKLLEETPYDENLRIVSDWKFFLDQIVLRNVSYHAVDLQLCHNQIGGISWDEKRLEREREQVFSELFSPMELDLFRHFMNHKYAYMTPYYDYIDQHPQLAKWLRRFVRMHKKIHRNG